MTVLFELILGMELLEEQMERYTSIINKYNEYNNSIKPYEIKPIQQNILKNMFKIKGGSSISHSNFIYPLHHFMMGKGKSKVLTPILMLYFIYICNKTVFIIVPSHLENQTIKTIDNYINVFNIDKEKIIIYSIYFKKNLNFLFMNSY